MDTRNADIWTIWYAAQYGKLERMRSLLARKAVQSIDVQEYRTGWSALHYASRYGQIAIVQVLIDSGADPDLPDRNGNTPLHLCAGWGNLRCCVLVLEGGASPNATNHAHQTPLDVAVSLGRADNRKLLESWRPGELTNEELVEQRTAAAANSSARILTQQLVELQQTVEKESNQAIRLELHALHSKTSSFGSQHPGLLLTLQKLASMYRQDHRLDEAHDILERGLALCELLNGDKHSDTAIWLNAMGDILLLHLKLDESLHCFTYAYNIIRELHGDGYHQTLMALENMAVACYHAKSFAETEIYLGTILRHLREQYNDGYNERIFHLSTTLAFVILEQRRIEDAQALYSANLTHAEQIYGHGHANIITCLDGLGKCCFILGEFDNAERYFQRSLQLLLKQPTDAQWPQPQNQPRGVPALPLAVQRAHSNVAMVAIARRSATATRAQLVEYRSRSV